MPNTTAQLEWDEVHAILSDYSLDGGGCWSPPDCQPRHSGLYIDMNHKLWPIIK